MNILQHFEGFLTVFGVAFALLHYLSFENMSPPHCNCLRCLNSWHCYVQFRETKTSFHAILRNLLQSKQRCIRKSSRKLNTMHENYYQYFFCHSFIFLQFELFFLYFFSSICNFLFHFAIFVQLSIFCKFCSLFFNNALWPQISLFKVYRFFPHIFLGFPGH